MGRLISVVPIVLGIAILGCAGKENSVLDQVKTGEYWYAMLEPSGKSNGYCRMELTTPEGGGLACEWELRLAFTGGTYEENRAIAFDMDATMISADYRTPEKTVSDGKREGNRFVGKATGETEGLDFDVEIPDDAASGMLFVLCPTVPREEGGKIVRTELDEAHAFREFGKTELVFAGTEKLEWEGSEIEVAKIEIRKENGQVMPVWVDGEGRIVKSDWGGGNIMLLSSTPTKELFKPEEPAVTEVDSTAKVLLITGEFPKFTPEEVFDHFVDPELLKTWWAPQAEVELEADGNYTLQWPGPEWVMRGKVKDFERGKRFVFTWNWDHMPDLPERTVTVSLSPGKDGGTRLDLSHGPYGKTEAEAKDRKGHLDGWQFFFAKLRALR